MNLVTPRLVTTQILVTTTKMGNIFRRCSGTRSLNTEVDYLSFEENLQNQRLSQLDTRTSRNLESVNKIQEDTTQLIKNQEIVINDQVMMLQVQKMLESRLKYQERNLNKLSTSIKEMGNHLNRSLFLQEKSTTDGKIIFKVDEHVFIWNNKTLQDYIREEVARQLANQSDQEDELPALI